MRLILLTMLFSLNTVQQEAEKTSKTLPICNTLASLIKEELSIGIAL